MFLSSVSLGSLWFSVSKGRISVLLSPKDIEENDYLLVFDHIECKPYWSLTSEVSDYDYILTPFGGVPQWKRMGLVRVLAHEQSLCQGLIDVIPSIRKGGAI